MLAADAASTCSLWAGELVLFGSWRRTHTLRAGRPPSPVKCSAAACTPHRLNVGVSRRKPPRAPGSWPRADARFELDARRLTGWLPALRSSAADLTPSAAVPSPSCAWARISPWPGLRGCRLSRRCVDPLGRALLRVSTGASRVYPPSCGGGSRTAAHPPPSRRAGRSESPSAVSDAHQENPAGIAHGERRSA
jgi:hypothetical protein